MLRESPIFLSHSHMWSFFSGWQCFWGHLMEIARKSSIFYLKLIDTQHPFLLGPFVPTTFSVAKPQPGSFLLNPTRKLPTFPFRHQHCGSRDRHLRRHCMPQRSPLTLSVVHWKGWTWTHEPRLRHKKNRGPSRSLWNCGCLIGILLSWFMK